MIQLKKIINIVVFLLMIVIPIKAQSTFENALDKWYIQNAYHSNYFRVGYNAGNGNSISGIKSIYVTPFFADNYTYIADSSTCKTFKEYTVVPNSNYTLFFDYKIGGSLGYMYNNMMHTSYARVIASYDSTNWFYLDSTLIISDGSWKQYSCNNISFNQPNIFIGFQFQTNSNLITFCPPLAIDNVVLVPDVTLPILLTNFIIKYSDCIIDVSFTTSAEVNTKEFYLQYSTNGTIWMDLYRFKGKGTCLTPTPYQRNNIPFFPLMIDNYFRIVEVDVFDNRYNYDIVVLSLVNDCEDNMQYYDVLGRYYEGGLIKVSKNTKSYNDKMH